MNLISEMRATCTRIRERFCKIAEDMDYKQGAIFYSEGLAFCAMLDICGADMLIESGVAYGQSTEMWARWFKGPIVAIGNDGYGVLAKTRDRLAGFQQLTILQGDSRDLVPGLIEEHKDKRIAVFIDGPKGRQALLLAKQCLENPAVVFVGVHDTSRGHFLDGWGRTVFYTDEVWFRKRYGDLDDRVDAKELAEYPDGPGIGFAVRDPDKMLPACSRLLRRVRFLLRRLWTLLRQGAGGRFVLQRARAHMLYAIEAHCWTCLMLNRVRRLRSRSLTSLGVEYGTDKATKHAFTEIYDRVFRKLRFAPVRLLEIGIKTGASLSMWEAYFPRATVYGLDLNPKPHKNTDRIRTFVGNQEDRNDLESCIKEIGSGLDIIIDDGGHTMRQQQVSLAYLFPYVKPGGVYVVEDLHCGFNKPDKFGAHPDQSNNTCRMLETFTADGRIKSEYMSEKEAAYLQNHIARCEIFRTGSSDAPSITSVIYKKPCLQTGL
jgi:cephalosporin hydroxylase